MLVMICPRVQRSSLVKYWLEPTAFARIQNTDSGAMHTQG